MALHLELVTKRFGNFTAVDDLTLSVGKVRCTVFLVQTVLVKRQLFE